MKIDFTEPHYISKSTSYLRLLYTSKSLRVPKFLKGCPYYTSVTFSWLQFPHCPYKSCASFQRNNYGTLVLSIHLQLSNTCRNAGVSKNPSWAFYFVWLIRNANFSYRTSTFTQAICMWFGIFLILVVPKLYKLTLNQHRHSRRSLLLNAETVKTRWENNFVVTSKYNDW